MSSFSSYEKISDTTARESLEDKITCESCTSASPKETSDCGISEDELFDVLQEVEDEAHREDVEDAELHEQYLQDQISHFEQWEESQAMGGDNSDLDQVLCPVCNDSDHAKLPAY